MQGTGWGEEVMYGEEGVVESRPIIWVERVVRGGRRKGRFVIGGWRGAEAMGGRGGKFVGAGHVEEPWGAADPTQKDQEVLGSLRFSAN